MSKRLLDWNGDEELPRDGIYLLKDRDEDDEDAVVRHQFGGGQAGCDLWIGPLP